MTLDLGRVLWCERVHRRWTRLGVPVVIGLPAIFLVSRSWLAVLATAVLILLIFARGQRLRLEVRERGVVVVSFISKQRYAWSEITAFSPMPLSTGRPGFSGSVVVSGVNHEILALGEPGLYEKLRKLNALLIQHRPVGREAFVPPQLDGRRSDFTRRRMTLRLGPGAAWWPKGPRGTEAERRSTTD